MKRIVYQKSVFIRVYLWLIQAETGEPILLFI